MVMKGDEMFSQAAAVRNTGTVAVCLKGYTGNQDTASIKTKLDNSRQWRLILYVSMLYSISTYFR